MPIRHALYPPIRADNFAKKSLRFTVKPTANLPTLGQLVVSISVGNPALMANYPALAFDQTSPGRPSFLFLIFAQQHTDTPITISTDASNYFQVATDSRPNFAPTLTFTPLSTGTYVHIRYLSGRSGLHQGQLFIETPYISRTVALIGRSRGLLPTVDTHQLLARFPKTDYSGWALTGNWWAGLLAVALVGGLALGGYSYCCQLFPSLCPDGMAGQTLTERSRSNAAELIISKKSTLTELKADSGSVETSKTRLVSSISKVSAIKRTLKRMVPGSIQNQRSEASPSGIARNLVSRRSLTKQVDNIHFDSRLQPVPATNPASEESELERELNRKF